MRPSLPLLTRERLALRSHAGFTLVELLVTITILSLGLLAMAGSAVAIARLERGGARLSGGAGAAESRLELLRASSCTPASGSSSEGALSESWSTAPLAGAVHSLVDSVAIARSPSAATGAAPHVYVYRSAARC